MPVYLVCYGDHGMELVNPPTERKDKKKQHLVQILGVIAVCTMLYMWLPTSMPFISENNLSRSKPEPSFVRTFVPGMTTTSTLTSRKPSFSLDLSANLTATRNAYEYNLFFTCTPHVGVKPLGFSLRSFLQRDKVQEVPWYGMVYPHSVYLHLVYLHFAYPVLRVPPLGLGYEV